MKKNIFNYLIMFLLGGIFTFIILLHSFLNAKLELYKFNGTSILYFEILRQDFEFALYDDVNIMEEGE